MSKQLVDYQTAKDSLIQGKRIARRGWPVWLSFDETQQSIMVSSYDHELVPWTPTIRDTSAIDWIVEGEN